MNLQIEPNHLKYFYFTVLEGGVSRAAQRLCVQQPVVSKMIKSLEGQLAQPLFRKSGRTKELTDFGQLVFRHCQVVFHEIDKIGQLQGNDEKISGSISFGAVEPVAAKLLPKVLSDISTQYPEVNANVYSATAKQLLSMISERQLEFGLFFHLPKLLDNLEIAEKIPTQFRLVVKKSLRKNKSVLQRFIGSREVDDTATNRYPTLERMRRDFPKVRITLSSNHLGLHREMVLLGQGVAILPEFLVIEDLKAGRLVDVYSKEKILLDLKFDLKFDLKIVKRKADMPSLLAKKLIEGIKS